MILPTIVEIARRHPERTVFTRFIPTSEPGKGPGAWGRYYERWAELTLSEGGTRLIALTPPLDGLVPPARVLDKHVYSPWTEGGLDQLLAGTGVDTLIVTGGETDVCVFATVVTTVPSRARRRRPGPTRRGAPILLSCPQRWRRRCGGDRFGPIGPCERHSRRWPSRRRAAPRRCGAPTGDGPNIVGEGPIFDSVGRKGLPRYRLEHPPISLGAAASRSSRADCFHG